MGAGINQRPELVRAAIAEAGVMDMLRFQKFTGGYHWISETGSSEDAEQFKFLLRYSPLHNIQPRKPYPAVLVAASDHDDRVVPAHSYKYVAALQASVARERPVLMRVDTKSGHSASSIEKEMERTADMFVFLMRQLEVGGR